MLVSDEPGQTMRAGAAGDYSEFHFGLTELRVLSSDANRARHGCFASAAKGKAVNRGDHGFAEIFDQIEDTLSKRARLLRLDGRDLRELVDVGAGNKCFEMEEHTSELQSHLNLVCRLLLEKKKPARLADTTRSVFWTALISELRRTIRSHSCD